MQDDIYCIDPCCQVRNLYANTGHGSKGWTYSWGSAVLLAKVETETQAVVLQPDKNILCRLCAGKI